MARVRQWIPEQHPRHPRKTPGGVGGRFREVGPDWQGLSDEEIETAIRDFAETERLRQEAGPDWTHRVSMSLGRFAAEHEGLQELVEPALNLAELVHESLHLATAQPTPEWTAPPKRPSGLPADRRPVSGDFEDMADRIFRLKQNQIYEILQDLTATELAKLARKFPGDPVMVPGWNKVSARETGLRIPDGLTLDEKRLWLAREIGGDWADRLENQKLVRSKEAG